MNAEFSHWHSIVDRQNLDWTEAEMRRVVQNLPTDEGVTRKLKIFNSHSRAELQQMVELTLRYLRVMSFEAVVGDIDKIVGEDPDPVWRAIIHYRFSTYGF